MSWHDGPIPRGYCQCGCGRRTTVAQRTRARWGHVKGEPVRFIRGHHGRKKVRYVAEDRGYRTPCWIWQLTLRHGYGDHRGVYEEHRGPIPEGLELDHLCRVRACVNPEHLEVVTSAENTRRSDSITGVNARKTHCPRGHPYDAANTYMHRGSRNCRACAREAAAASRRKQAA